ncbi:DEKNAAC101695 [Brettanomyces naardenensis]|uniref:Prefoldin subunit 4 n=1 Tax=Brettanomyces naardenensis TaxID=13370 RepID=A0A448YIU1_BRENA|nr:DEKNAAC101695 [Brettanomyces naardenensis]
MQILPEGEKNTTDVSWEDQQKINEFSTLITRKDRFSEQLKGYQTEKEFLDDLSMEIELLDEDDDVNYKVGDAFILLKQSEAVDKLEKQNAHLDSEIMRLELQIEELDGKLAELKKRLYAKFGTAINLER